jgi:putative transposase
MTRSIEFSIGEFYHIYNRGTEKRKIFLSKTDYERFVSLLYLCNSKESVQIGPTKKSLEDILLVNRDNQIVDIGAYCLMPNHFHLLLHESIEDGISKFMQKLTTAYTMYFNKKNERTGALFQGVFKAEHANNDEYLKYLFAYIHLNPVKINEPNWKEDGIKNIKTVNKLLINYPYSSYHEYSGSNRLEKKIINKEAFPEYFEKITDFKEMINYYLNFNNISTQKKH